MFGRCGHMYVCTPLGDYTRQNQNGNNFLSESYNLDEIEG